MGEGTGLAVIPGRKIPRGQISRTRLGLVASLHVLAGTSPPIKIAGPDMTLLNRRLITDFIVLAREDVAIVPENRTMVESVRECRCGYDVRDVSVEFLWPGPSGELEYRVLLTRVREVVSVRRYDYRAGSIRISLARAWFAFLAIPARRGLSGARIVCACGELLGLIHANVEANGGRAACLLSDAGTDR